MQLNFYRTGSKQVDTFRNRHQVRAAVGRYRTANLRGFGSLVHGTYQDGSDIDLLVDALPGATLFDLGGLQEGLESILGQTL